MPDGQNPTGATPAAQNPSDQGDGSDATGGNQSQRQQRQQGSGDGNRQQRSPASGEQTDGGEPLGTSGMAALRSERDARETAEAALREARRELTDAQNQRERDIANARVEARQEVLDQANTRLVAASIIAAAAGRLANPQLGPRLVDATGIGVDAKGEVDTAEIGRRIDKLLESDPYLAARPRTPAGSGDGGSRGTPVPIDMNARIRRAAGRR